MNRLTKEEMVEFIKRVPVNERRTAWEFMVSINTDFISTVRGWIHCYTKYNWSEETYEATRWAIKTAEWKSNDNTHGLVFPPCING